MNPRNRLGFVILRKVLTFPRSEKPTETGTETVETETASGIITCSTKAAGQRIVVDEEKCYEKAFEKWPVTTE